MGGTDAGEGPGLGEIDTSVAHPARVYDAWLGGKDHFAADREAAEEVKKLHPGIVPGVRYNRAFLVRAVRWLAAEAGIRQFLDLGTGLPSANNVHEVAQGVDPQARVVYVDFDPIVLVHARALLQGTPGTVAYVQGDVRDVGGVLARAGATLDLTQPVAVMLLATLQFVPDDDDPHRLVRDYLAAVPSGSHLVVSHPAVDPASPGASVGIERYNELVATKMTRRPAERIAAFFDGLDLVEPRVVPMTRWRPGPGDDVPERPEPTLCGVARKP